MFMSGPGFAAILDHLGTADQKRWAELMIDLRWGATMVLTEPDAGSDVGAGRTRAFDNGDGTWRIEGVKRFITSGEHDMSDNIVHLVLARPEGAGAGTKGLSLFLVPKFHVDLATGELKERNGVYATNVEKKMGIKVSTTCELTFGDSEPAVANAASISVLSVSTPAAAIFCSRSFMTSGRMFAAWWRENASLSVRALVPSWSTIGGTPLSMFSMG
jgi:alkylation response protein AidB-like acyl-CoA dehydrogenase